MSNVKQLVVAQAFVSDATTILDEAKAQGFDYVLVFGFKDKTVNIKASAVASNLEVMGALEAAKQQIWGNA